MGRIRTIKPEFFKHEELYDLEMQTHLPIRVAFAGLWTVADRQGRFRWRIRSLKADVLPFDDVDFSLVLNALASSGFILKYSFEGQFYGYIPSWNDHQFINNKEPQSDLPTPVEVLVVEEVDAMCTRDERVTDASSTRGVKEGKGKEVERKEKPSASLSASRDGKHGRIREAIQTAWSERNPEAPCPWGAPEGNQLNQLLRRTTSWPEHLYVQCLANMYDSDGFTGSSPPLEFISRLPKYLKGPLNEFGRLKGTSSNGSQQRQNSTISNAREAIERLRGMDSGSVDGLGNQAGHALKR